MTKAPSQKPRVIPPPQSLRSLGPLVVVDGDCPYFNDSRANRTAFALPGTALKPAEYESAMGLGMRRSGALIYRPLCPTCRRCQPIRVDVERFALSRSQKRVQKRCSGLFQVEIGRPLSDPEHLTLYARYQAAQHGADGQTADQESYERFLCESVADTFELAWRDKEGKLVGVGIIDVVPTGISTVYFYWEPDLGNLSLGVYSALHEIELCKTWGKRYYYLGYLVAGSKTMSYKASYQGAEVWTGAEWQALPSRDIEEHETRDFLERAEKSSNDMDARNFRLE